MWDSVKYLLMEKIHLLMSYTNAAIKMLHKSSILNAHAESVDFLGHLRLYVIKISLLQRTHTVQNILFPTKVTDFNNNSCKSFWDSSMLYFLNEHITSRINHAQCCNGRWIWCDSLVIPILSTTQDVSQKLTKEQYVNFLKKFKK